MNILKRIKRKKKSTLESDLLACYLSSTQIKNKKIKIFDVRKFNE